MIDHTISEEKAKRHTKNWRTYYAETYNAYPQPEEAENKKPIAPGGSDTFRGFTISIEDLAALKEIIDTFNIPGNPNPINAVRVYLANKNADSQKTTSKDMHVLIVPVTKDGKDLLSISSTGSSTQSSSSTILNFTSPCPETCDTQSSLY